MGKTVHGVCEFWEGMGLGAIALMSHMWALTYPFVTAVTAICAMILAVHGVYRLVWRWWHGLPIMLLDKEILK